MLEELAITGVGMVTPLGANTAATWDALLRGESITTHHRLPIEGDNNLSRVSRLATIAAREALQQAAWAASDRSDMAIVVGTSKGPIESWLTTPPPLSDKDRAAGRLTFGLASTAQQIADELELSEVPRLTVSAACASGLHALIRATLMIRHGHADRVLVVAAEASVHPLFLGSFARLGVLAADGERCRPFDLHRSGFLMSEAAAAVCLERHRPQRRTGALAFIAATAMGADSQGLVAADPAGSTLRRILHACSADAPIDLYHAHGTGTVLNDAVELSAIEHAIAEHPAHGTAGRPVIYSHKGAIGHTLGAAGLLGIALSVQCHRRATIPGNVNLLTTMPIQRVTLASVPVYQPIRRSITSASGFGGAIAAVSLKPAV